MLCLYVQSPFATFRTFTAGSFRPTSGFITPSAAYGLLLNVAGIEMREDVGDLAMTTIKQDLPQFRLALGALSLPLFHSVYQQLHNYPIGESGKEHAPATKGNKYNIAPVRRAFLSGIRGYVCLEGNADMEKWVRSGLKGGSARSYGLPFLGDNNFLVDRLEPVEKREPAYWFEQVVSDQDAGLRNQVTRMTVAIDREDMSRTQSTLFAPKERPSVEIPEAAWVEVGY